MSRNVLIAIIHRVELKAVEITVVEINLE